MSYEDIACMELEKMEEVIKQLLAIAGTVAILGEGMPISKQLSNAAQKFM